MDIKELKEINWEAVTVDDLKRAHELKGMSFEFNNGRLTNCYVNPEAAKREGRQAGGVWLSVIKKRDEGGKVKAVWAQFN